MISLKLFLNLMLLALVYNSANSFTLSLEQVSELPKSVTLRMLQERGVMCEDCSRQEAADELLQWQHLPVKKKLSKVDGSGKQQGGKHVHDEANVQEVLNQLSDGGFGPPSFIANNLPRQNRDTE